MLYLKKEYLELFDINILYCLADEPDEISEKFACVGLDGIENAHGLASKFDWQGKRSFLIAVTLNLVDKPQIGVISHESVHLAQYIVDSIGYKQQETEDEILSHFSEYITNRYIKFLKKINKFVYFI